jgi:hypothetical protein
VIAAVIGWRTHVATNSVAGLCIRLHTQQIGDGIVPGTQVRANGVLIGSVTGIAPDALGTQMISLRLDPSRLDGLDQSLHLDYATANLFGISEVDLRPGNGGTPLRDGAVIDLTGPAAGRTCDATMGSLLRSVSQVSTKVLTPELSDVLSRLGGDARAFTPLLQALVVTARAAADTQHIPASQQLAHYGAALGGVAPFAGAVIRVIDQVYRIDALRNDRPRLDATIDMAVGQLFPALETTLNHADDHFSAYTAMLVPILSAAAKMVPAPDRSSAQLRAVLRNLRSAMSDTPDGPALNLDVDLRGVPALAATLPAGQGAHR